MNQVNEPKLPFVLTIEEKRNPLWRRLIKQWEGRLDELRKQNDTPRGETETSELRGRIAEVKCILALNKDLPQ